MNRYYKYFENENLLMLFVNEEFGKVEWCSVRNTDTNKVISYVKYNKISNDLEIEFTEHFPGNTKDVQVLQDFQLNLEFRTNTEI